MIDLQFKLKSDDRLYLSEKWICNGHWMLKREMLHCPTIPKPFKALQNLAHGSYLSGYKHPPTPSEFPNFEQVIPDRTGYAKATLTGHARVSDMLRVVGIEYATPEGARVWIAPEYAPLLTLGEVWIKNEKMPVRIEHEGEILGVVMPVRVEVSNG